MTYGQGTKVLRAQVVINARLNFFSEIAVLVVKRGISVGRLEAVAESQRCTR